MSAGYLPLDVLRYDGYLQEVNRQFFHPLGLALGVTTPDDGAEPRLVVVDWREDPAGVRFSDDQDLAPKAAQLWRITSRRRTARVEALGYWVQPTGDRA